jgi:hypothetical protein
VEWLRNGETVDSAVAQTSYSGGSATLRISSVSPLDQGEYCCQATNSAGFQASKATLTVVTSTTESPHNGHTDVETNGHTGATDDTRIPAETTKEAVMAPAIRRDIESKIVKETDTAILECEFDDTVTTVTWLRHGKEIKEGGDFKFESAGTTYRLVITSARVEESGTFQCDGVNPKGVSSSVGSLLVISAASPPVPLVVKLPQPCTVAAGTPAKFTLELDDISNYTVTWFKGADKLEKSDKMKSVKSGNTFKLEFKGVELSDAGQYTVKLIKDKKAISKYTASLNVA